MAQVFEFHFNPKAKDDTVFDSFIFEPETSQEKKLGNLYFAGSVSNLLPNDFKFLDNLASIINGEYYKNFVLSPEIALKSSLKKANDFLSEIAKKGNVGWLGKLNLAVLNIISQKPFGRFRMGSFELNFTKTGDIKILLLRDGEILEISKDLSLKDIEPYPLKIFGNILTGKVLVDDKIVILTKEVFEALWGEELLKFKKKVSKNNLLKAIANLEVSSREEMAKRINGILKERGEELAKISGLMLLIWLKESAEQKLSQPKITFGSSRQKAKFLLFPIFSFKNTLNKSFGFKKIQLPKLKNPFKKIALPKFPQLEFSGFRKNLILIVLLVLILLLGNFVFSWQREREIKSAKIILEEISAEQVLAENSLDEKTANLIYQEILTKILNQKEELQVLKKEVRDIESQIKEKLIALNRIEEIENPEIFFDFNQINITPQKMIYSQDSLYFFSLANEFLYKLNLTENKGELIENDQKFSFGAPLDENSFLFFSEPNLLTLFENGQLVKNFTVELPYPQFTTQDLSIYGENLYLLHSERAEIQKYSFDKTKDSLLGFPWLQNKKEDSSPLSMAIDKNIWILNQNSSIDRYYQGKYQETLNLYFYPQLEKAIKIFTSPILPDLYILEPENNRLIIIEKDGKIKKQFQSEKFDNLLDFAVSENWGTIYLLNNQKLYRISNQS